MTGKNCPQYGIGCLGCAGCGLGQDTLSPMVHGEIVQEKSQEAVTRFMNNEKKPMEKPAAQKAGAAIDLALPFIKLGAIVWLVGRKVLGA